MKETIIKCSCDYCKESISEWEHDSGVKITIRVDVPNPSGGAGDCEGGSMVICNDCAKTIGIIPKEIHNGTVGVRSRIKNPIEKFKVKILEMFFNIKKGD